MSDTVLQPIEKPNGLIMNLAYYYPSPIWQSTHTAEGA